MEGKAYEFWRFENYGYFETERGLSPFMGLRPAGPWLKRIREARFLSTRSVAKRLGISPQAYSKTEHQEDKMTLEKLRVYARALDCDLVYALVPKRYPSKVIWDTVHPYVAKSPRLTWARHPFRILALLVTEKMFEPEFRQSQGWAQNNTDKAHGVARMCKTFQDIARACDNSRPSCKSNY